MSNALFPQASWEEGEMDACLNLCASAELLHDLVQGIVARGARPTYGRALAARGRHGGADLSGHGPACRAGDVHPHGGSRPRHRQDCHSRFHLAQEGAQNSRGACRDARPRAHGCRDFGALREPGAHRPYRAPSPRALGWPRLSRWSGRHRHSPGLAHYRRVRLYRLHAGQASFFQAKDAGRMSRAD